MGFNKDLYVDVIRTTNDEVIKDENVPIMGSIWSEADHKVKEFFEQNSNIDDSKKSEIYANFLMSLVQTTLQQELQNAKDIALEQGLRDAQIEATQKELILKEKLNDAQIADLEITAKVKAEQSEKDLALKDAQIAEAGQKIISMQNHDKNENARTGIALAEMKFKIEKLFPLQEQELKASVRNQEIQADIKQKELEIKGEELELKKQEREIREAELEIKKLGLEIEKVKLKLVEAQAEAEKARAEVLKGELKLKQEQFKFDKEYNYPLDREQKLADAELRKEQAKGVANGIRANLKIEQDKCDNAVDVAYIYSSGNIK